MAQSYTTQSGDTLWDIATRFYGDGSWWTLIYDANKLIIGNDPTNLFAGKTLTIPDKPGTTPPPSGSQTYVTKSGDTLWDIAMRFYADGSKWTLIYNANRAVIGNDANNLTANLTLTIPANTQTPTPPGGMTPTPISGANITDSPAAVYYERTRSFHAFGRSSDGTLVQHFAGTWENLGRPQAAVSGAPGAVVRAPISLHVAVCGEDTRLYHKFYNGGNWSEWENRGGDLASGPSLASWSPARLDIFARGKFSNLIHSWWDLNGGWANWEDLSPKLPVRNDIQFAPSAVSWGPNRIDVVAVRASDSHLVHAWWDGASWQGWEDLGGVLTESPSIVSRGLNLLDIFGRGTDNQIYRRSWDGRAWSNWVGMGPFIPSAPAAAVGPGAISLLARNAANQLIQIR